MKQNRFCLIALLLVLGLMCTACTVPTGERQSAASAEYEDVTPILQEADTLFDSGEYLESLDRYLTAMEKNDKDMDARLGAARCQIELGNYDIAAKNLLIAQKIDASDLEICNLYLHLSEKSDRPFYAEDALRLAEKYGHESILEQVPAAPVMDYEPGSYSERLFLTITCEDPDAEVYVSLQNSENSEYALDQCRYTNPILLLRGENHVSVYSVKNGIPSEMVTETYSISYDSVEVSFQEPLIEKIVRDQLNIPAGPLTNYDCEKVIELDWYSLQRDFPDYQDYMQLKLSSLEDLQYLPALRNLRLEHQTEITDYSPLTNCPLLSEIMLSGCELTDTSLLKYTPNATVLGLMGNDIADAADLENLTQLEMLQINDNNENLKLDQVLRNNRHINTLFIDDTQLQDYGVLLEMEDLFDLYISGLSYIDYEQVGKLTNLTSLGMSYNYRREYGENITIGDLSFLPQMDQLEYLYLSGVSDPSDLTYIQQLPNLMELSLYGCEVTENWETMEQLQKALPNCSIDY